MVSTFIYEVQTQIMPVETRKSNRSGRHSGTRSHAGGSTPKNYDEGLNTRPSCYRETVTDVYENARVGNLYRCAIRDELYEKSDMSIDHKENWRSWCLRESDVDDKDDLRRAYNDIRNLRLVHKSENSSKGNR
jgi:hypothetical protein